MGVKVHDAHHGFIYCEADKLKGADIQLDFPSVGATENIMLAAVFAEGDTIIRHAAREPEIVDLQKFLIGMGVDITGAGTSIIRIKGNNKKLRDVEHTVIPDRIVAGTYLVAAAITGGDITLRSVMPEHLIPVITYLRECGCRINTKKNTIHIFGPTRPKAIDIIRTLPYPGFPTDMQAQMTTLMTKANGTSMVIETIFENRFMHLAELKRMGANVKIEGRSAIIEGKPKLTGAMVRATDLRAGAALILAGLIAEGITEVTEIEHIDRGYVRIDEKLNALGANIKRVEDEDLQ